MISRLHNPETRPTKVGGASLRSFVGFAPLLAACAGAYAADPDPDPSRLQPPSDTSRYEIAAFGGFRLGGSLKLNETGQSVHLDDHASFGVAFDVRADDNSWYELFYGRQSTRVSSGSAVPPTSIRVDYLQIGGTLVLDEQLPVKPFILGGLGATRFTPDPAQGHNDTRFAVSLGAGMRVPINPHFSLRLEARGFFTLLNSDTAFLCRSDQTGALCQVRSRGSSFIQYDLLAGAAYAF